MQERTDVSAETAVALMAGYFGGVLLGRVLGSRLALRHDPARLLGWALVVTAIGFALVWSAVDWAQAAPGIAILGVGVGNLFPMAVSSAVAISPDRAGQVSGRAVAASAAAVLLAPLTIGLLADASSLVAALSVVPVLLAIAGVGLVLLRRLTHVNAGPS
jgi:fucose permease